MSRKLISLFLCLAPMVLSAQTFTHYTSVDNAFCQESRIKLTSKAPEATPMLTINGDEKGMEFKAWGTCFNELDLDAIKLLKETEQKDIMKMLFSPQGDLRFTRGRLTMNANDYSREWYSCSDVWGDLELKYFNIEHDKENVIQLIRMAQREQPQLTFWMSPWSPPTWMKINGDYPVLSSRYNKMDKRQDYLLYSDEAKVDPDEMKLLGDRQGVFPRRLATKDYFIQDPAYLQAYANMFCRFIELYEQEGIPIDMVMYQNEAYSYTPYPGCAWTAEGTVRFNHDYLAPTLRQKHPEVHLYLGTFNTNRLDYVDKIVGQLQGDVEGLGFQWEARENLDHFRQHYPQLRLIQTESECGNGSMDWPAGEHTFGLMCDYIGRGCEEYYIWNFILTGNGQSPWGWRQNALIQVDQQKKTYRLTPEYFAVKHFARFVEPGSRMVAYKASPETPVIAFVTPGGKRIIIAGNFASEPKPISVKLGKRNLASTLPPHSFHTFVEKNK